MRGQDHRDNRYAEVGEPPTSTAPLTNKGPITIPVAVREALHVSAGDRVEFVEIALGRYEFIAATRSVKTLKGLFAKPDQPVTIE